MAEVLLWLSCFPFSYQFLFQHSRYIKINFSWLRRYYSAAFKMSTIKTRCPFSSPRHGQVRIPLRLRVLALHSLPYDLCAWLPRQRCWADQLKHPLVYDRSQPKLKLKHEAVSTKICLTDTSSHAPSSSNHLEEFLLWDQMVQPLCRHTHTHPSHLWPLHNRTTDQNAFI